MAGTAQRLYDKRSTGVRGQKLTSNNVAQLFDLVQDMDGRIRIIEKSISGILGSGFVVGGGVANYHTVWNAPDSIRASGHVWDDNTNLRTGYGIIAPANLVHLYSNNATDLLETADKQQLLIEQGGAGDAGIGFEVAAQRWSIGIDNSDADKFKLRDITGGTYIISARATGVDITGTLDVSGTIELGASCVIRGDAAGWLSIFGTTLNPDTNQSYLSFGDSNGFVIGHVGTTGSSDIFLAADRPGIGIGLYSYNSVDIQMDASSAGGMFVNFNSGVNTVAFINGVGDGYFLNTLEVDNIPHAVIDTDKFLVDDSSIIKYRTGAEVLSDIGANTRSMCIENCDSATQVAVANGVDGFSIPADMNGWNLTAVLAAVHTKGITGTTDIMIRRRRAGSDADMLSTAVTLGDEFYVADGTIDTDYDDINTGDLLYVDVDAVHTTEPYGMSITLTFTK